MSDKELVSIAREFCMAAARKEQQDPEYGDRLLSTMAMNDAMKTVSRAKRLSGMRRQFGDAVETNPEYVSLLMRFADTMAESHLKIAAEKNVAALLPGRAKSAEISSAFEEKGAHNLAKLAGL